MDAPKSLKEYEELIAKENIKLKKAEDNPNYIQIQIQIEECKEVVKNKDEEHETSIKKIIGSEKTMEINSDKIDEVRKKCLF